MRFLPETPEERQRSLRLLLAALPLIVGLAVLAAEWSNFAVRSRPPSEAERQAAELIAGSGFIGVLFSVFVVPFLEEVIFRGFVLERLLRRMRPLPAILLGAAIFAVLHLNLFQMVPALVTGVLFGVLYAATRSLLLPVLAHFCWNGFALLSGRVLNPGLPGFASLEPGGAFPFQPVWYVALAAVLAGVGAWMLAARLREAPELRTA